MYPWQNEENSLKRARALEERREVILEQLQDRGDSAAGGQEALLAEWLELVRERDRLLRERVEEANERTKVECLVDLRRLLKDLGGLVSGGQDDDVDLRRDLASLYRQVDTFCTQNSISAVDLVVDTPPQCPPPAAPPMPPPPPPLMSSLNTASTPWKRKSNGGEQWDGDDSDKEGPAAKKVRLATPCISQQTPFRHESPLQNFNRNLIMSISGGLMKRQLKRTTGDRSPGGTPRRKERRLDANDPADAIALALQRKFRNVPVRSPLTPCDENNDCSGVFASPVLQPVDKRPVPLATVSASQSPAMKENSDNASLVQTI